MQLQGKGADIDLNNAFLAWKLDYPSQILDLYLSALVNNNEIEDSKERW